MQGKTLAERRKAVGLSQQELATRARCSVARVGQVERENPPAGKVRDAMDHALTVAEQARDAEGPRNWSGDSELPEAA